jgi:transposase InsO family protein
VAKYGPLYEELLRTMVTNNSFSESSSMVRLIAAIAAELLRSETVYNTARPHQALGQLTPFEHLTTHFTPEAV